MVDNCAAFWKSCSWKKKVMLQESKEGMVSPHISSYAGDLSLVLPKRILDGIIEMIYALDKIAQDSE